MDTFSKLHGTTVDRFQIGTKSQRLILSGTNNGNNTISLVDRDGNQYTADSTVFFTVNLIGQHIATAAFEVKGCYIAGISGVSGSVTNTYVNSNAIPLPTVSFNSSGLMTVNCTGISGQNLVWTAVVDIVKI